MTQQLVEQQQQENGMVDERVKQFIEQRKVSIAELSRATGLSTATISRYLSGSYKGDIERVRKSLLDYVEREIQRQQFERKEEFYETQVVRRIFELLRTCHLSSEFGVIVGNAGVGKTWALRRYAQQYSDAILFEVVPGASARFVFARIASLVGVDAGKSTIEAFNAVLQRLQNSGRLLIIDEAEHLDYKCLELLRRLWDFAGIGLVLCGMPRLLYNLRGRKREFGQLHSRVGFVYSIDKVDDEDIAHILPKSAVRAAKGSIRKAVKIAMQAQRLAQINGKNATDKEILQAAISLVEV